MKTKGKYEATEVTIKFVVVVVVAVVVVAFFEFYDLK